MAWKEQKTYVRRVEDLLLEVRVHQGHFTWSVTDGHYDSMTGTVLQRGWSELLNDAQGECFDFAIDFLDKNSPR